MGLNIALVNPVLRTPFVQRPFVVGSSQRVPTADLADTNIVVLARALGQLGHQVTIYAAGDFLEADENRVDDHVTIRAMPTRLKRLFNPSLIAFTPDLAMSKPLRESDIIQSGEFHLLTTYFSALAAREANIPLVVWQETFRHMIRPGRWYQQSYRLTLGHVVRAATRRFILRTKKAGPYLQSMGIPKSAIGPWIPTGIRADIYQPGKGTLSAEDFGLPKGFALGLVVARLDSSKGVDLGVKAVSLLRKRSVNVGLLVRGSGPEAESLAALAKREGVGDRVRFLERQAGGGMVNLYNSADFFLLPSRNDLLPFALLEAGACGRPAVATRVGCVDEFVQDGVNGILVSPNSAVSIASGIRRLLVDDRRREAMGTASRERFVQNYDVRVTAAKLAEVYRTATETRAPPSRAG